jgi:RNA polymerase-binding transcription factor DksA
MKCEECGKEIPAARLEALPNTTVCVKCSNVSKINEGFYNGEPSLMKYKDADIKEVKSLGRKQSDS